MIITKHCGNLEQALLDLGDEFLASCLDALSNCVWEFVFDVSDVFISFVALISLGGGGKEREGGGGRHREVVSPSSVD